MTSFTTRCRCRLCGSASLLPALDLADSPLANAFAETPQEARSQSRYPLSLKLCGDCGHLQLVVVVDPAVLFRDYVYVSGTSPSFVAHFAAYAEALSARLSLGPDDLVVDIGSNDGTFLKQFAPSGARVLGVDPAEKIAAAANAEGVETLAAFMTPQLAAEIQAEHGGARLVSANNVFAHTDALDALAQSVHTLLADDGLFTFEVSYLLDVVEKGLFDTIYHEHLDYHRVGPLRRFFDSHGMTLVDAERVPTHGGSLRGYVAKGRGLTAAGSVAALEREEREAGLAELETYRAFQDRIGRRGLELSSLLAGLRGANCRIAGYGAPAKAATLMHQFGLDAETLAYVVDDSPWKQGLYTPGQGVPVVAADRLESDPVDYLLILAWNFADPIIAKNAAFAQRGGRFITPLPDLCVRHD